MTRTTKLVAVLLCLAMIVILGGLTCVLFSSMTQAWAESRTTIEAETAIPAAEVVEPTVGALRADLATPTPVPTSEPTNTPVPVPSVRPDEEYLRCMQVLLPQMEQEMRLNTVAFEAGMADIGNFCEIWEERTLSPTRLLRGVIDCIDCPSPESNCLMTFRTKFEEGTSQYVKGLLIIDTFCDMGGTSLDLFEDASWNLVESVRKLDEAQKIIKSCGL